MISRDEPNRTPGRRRPPLFADGLRPWIAAVALGAAVACAPSVKRDLSRVPVGQVGFEDMCGLQNYYDAIAVRTATAPTVVDGADIERTSEGGTSRGGRARFAFETEFQLTTVKRVLEENWNGLPKNLPAARRIEINVNWSERSGLRRVANNSNPELVVDGAASSLAYHVCLSELLFGEPLYRRRRDILGLAPLPTAHTLALTPDDGGAPEGPVIPAPPPAPSPSPSPVPRNDAATPSPLHTAGKS